MKYTAFCDGGSRGNPGPAASGYVIFCDEKIINQGGEFLGIDTNNVAEWNSLILVLKKAKEDSLYPILIKMDSLLVVSQVQDKWKVKTPHLLPYYQQAKALMNKQITIQHVLRGYNKEADKVVNEILDNQA
jgi:ribonuclease HI